MGGAVPDYTQAAQWYRKAAEQGNSHAQWCLGGLYYLGHGVPQDYVRAHMWFNLAAAGASDKYRDLMVESKMAAKMTPAQIGEAQRMASEWKPKK